MITLPNLTPYTGDIVAPSPNHGARRAPVIHGIVLHATADEGNEARALSWMRSPKSWASCHLVVSRSGRVTRLVGDQQRAWHAGLAWWRGTRDVNSITLGIEIANRNDGESYTDAQYARVAAIVAHYCRQGLSLDDVVSHEEIAPGRRTDPRGWDWDRFRAMVQDQLRPADVEGRRSLIYDRRSVERRAADEAAVSRSPDDMPLPERVSGVDEHHEPAGSDAPGWERRSTPRGRRRVRASATRKPALRSRTIWLNGLTVLAAGSVIVGEILNLTFSVGLTLPREITMWALFGVGLVNIVLRFRTTCPIGSEDGAHHCSPSEAPIAEPGHVAGHA